MRSRIIKKCHRLVLALGLALFWMGGVQGQSVRFAQITDPHLFDLGEEGTQNKIALAACIKALNARMDENADYKFAVITGDIGVENLVSHVIDPKTKERVREDPATEERQLDEGAAQLASILAPTKIHVWLFVPGNNDLYLEEPNLNDYKRFLEKLKNKLPGLEIRDLCAADGSQNTYSISGLTLIGFNNASFKNNNELCRLWKYKTIQRGYVEQVIKQVKPNDPPALIFYHIPEVDDPHIILNSDTETGRKRKIPCADPSGFADREELNAWTKSDGGPYPDSSWFVYPDVLKEWRKNVVNNKKVLGLFAGHLHDWRRETYSGSLSKLYICPPLAVKLQSEKPSQARGFQEVMVDATGRISRTIFWFNAADETFDTDPSSKSGELELALFYENSQQWQQAESHFAEAAKTASSTSARNNALAGLARVKAAQHSWFKDLVDGTDPLISLGTFLLRVFLVVGILLVIFIVGIAVTESWGALVVHPFDGDEELAKAIARRFPAIGAKVKKLVDSPGHAFLPANVQSIPFIAPSLEGLLPAEPFEVAGVKVPDLNVFLRWIVRPQFQVTGGSVPSGQTTFVYVQIWRRRKWFGLGFVTVITRNIPKRAGRAKEIENLIYDIYLKANANKSVQNT